MRISKQFNIKQIADEYIIVPAGSDIIDFSNIIQINETAAFVWETFKDREFEKEDVIAAIREDYDNLPDNLEEDIDELITTFRNNRIIEG